MSQTEPVYCKRIFLSTFTKVLQVLQEIYSRASWGERAAVETGAFADQEQDRSELAGDLKISFHFAYLYPTLVF